jgi:AcrR family transcriptional regulator
VAVGEETVTRVACRIFRERGYHATSMRAIASALGMQPAALYYYYPSKEMLLFAIMENAVDGLTARVQAAIDPAAGPRERLRQAIEAHITTVVDHLDELTVFLHELKSLQPKLRERIQRKRVAYEHIFRNIIEEGIERGELRGVDPRLANLLILAACNWLYNRYRPGGTHGAGEIAAAFSDMLLHGLSCPPPPAPPPSRREGS